MRASLLVALVSSFAAAQQPTDKASLEGTVADAAGKPLKGVQLTLAPEGVSRLTLQLADARVSYPTSQSRNDGTFSFSLEPGRYLLLGKKAGFVQVTYGGKTDSMDGTILDLVPGQHVKGITLRMVPAATISGHVRDEIGKPLGDVDVTAERLGGGGGGPRTDAGGAFTISNLPPGQYRLRLRPPGRLASGTNGAQDEYVTTYYPTSAGDAQPGPIQLQAGDRLALDLVLAKRPVVRVSVRGRVTGAEIGMRLLLTEQDRYHFQTASSARPASDGSFEIKGVAPGRYKLISDDSNNLSAIKGWTEIEVGTGNLENVALALKPAVDLSGRVVIDGNHPAGLKITLWPPGFENGWRTGTVEADGTFVIAGVMQEKYQLQISSIPQSAYVASARVGDQEVTPAGFDFSDSAPRSPVVITLKRSAGEIGGTVRSAAGDAMPGAIVTLVPEPAGPGQPYLYRRVNTDQNGQFHLTGLAPGNYGIAAWTELERDAELAPDFQNGSAIAVAENSHQIVELPLVQGPAR